MSIKDLFNRSSQVVVSSSLKTLSQDAESPEYIQEYIEKQDRLEPHIDFSDPANFVKYGSAQEYYDKALKHIYGEYPYDGSLKEKIEWRNDATLLDLYIFDNRYPKTTGYAILSSDGWGTLTGSLSGGYGAPATGDYEYINIKGGPNSVFGSALGTSSLSDVFDSKSNIFDQTVTGSSGPVTGQRSANLQTNLDQGVTVEFWLQTGSLSTALTEKQVVFDLWNGELSSSAGYGRLRIELTGSGAPFLVTVLSGTTGYFQQSIGSSLTQNSLSDWAHYAISFANSGTDIVTRLYRNGELNDTLTAGTNISEIREDIEANIGALVVAPSGNVYTSAAIGEGWGKLSGSIDEFRFWKTRRTEKEISRNYFTSYIGGGTNTDTANLDLGVYFKFNEGITTNTATDSVVLDYSGRISNGTWEGYPSSNARNTGSAIVSASAGTENLDPIVRSNHPKIVDLGTELQLSGSLWDYENNSSLYFTMPTWIIEEDESNGTTGDLRKLTQVMSSYLDNLDLLVGELPKLNIASYPSSSTSGETFKIYPHIQTAVRSFGLQAPELFSNGNILEYYLNRDETKEFEEDLNTVKGIIYNNIYNNLTDIYKAKGTEKSFRNLIRCFGIGEDVIRINAYADNDTYKFDTKRRAGNYKSKAINFNHNDNFGGTVYQYADPANANSVSYISGSSTEGLTLEDSFPITVEAEAIFSKKISRLLENSNTQEFPFLTASLFGMHTPTATSPTETDLTWASSDVANFQVFAIRDKVLSDDVKFMLTSSDPFPIPELTSSFYQNTYNNEKWNFAVRVKPTGYPQSFSSGALDNDYVVEFYGVSYIADRQVNEFTLTGSIAKATAESLLTSPKRLFVGSHKTNFTGSTLQYTDAKITSCRYWFDYLDNEAIQNHAIDPGNFGHPRPNRDTYLLETDLPSVQVPEIESLALYWDFETVTGSDNGSGVTSTFDGKFTVQDVTSGSLSLVSRYNWLGKILKYQHTGRGDAFPINSTGSVEKQYLYAGKQHLPEIVFGDDNIRVLNQEETEVFTKETRPTKTYYAFEKSMYQVISDEIINYFGSIADFNNLIGDPVNRYRQEYKSLNYLRQFFFERVTNTPDLDKFVSYYKWIDSTLETMLMQLVPASAQFSDGIDNVVESHVLERNKYWSKFPTLEFNTPDPEGGTVSINKHLYDWKRGHRPISGEEEDNCLYWKERAERDDSPLSSSNAGVNDDRNSILSASLQVFERRWTTPYKYALDKQRSIHGGINYSENKKTNFYRGVNYPHGPRTSLGLPINVLNAYNTDVVTLKGCDDELAPNQKIKYSFGTNNGRANDSGSFDGIKGEIAMPFNILSASQGLGGYNSKVQDRFLSSSQLVNLHSDAYGDRNEVPMQGPFTQKYVGGHQHRHVRINNYDTTRVGGDGASTLNDLDGQYTRPEAWRLLLGGGPADDGAIGLTGPDYGGPYPDPQRFRAWWWREETAKRPVNIRNILQTTASVDTVLSGALQHGPIGNYEKTYQIVQSSGRSTNNFWFNDNGVTLPERYANNNPTTTNVHTLVGVRAETTTGNSARGNTFIPGTDVPGAPVVASLRRLSNRYYPSKTAPAQAERRTVFQLPDRAKQDAVIVERFSAPGGPEINSLGFLDIMAAEKSVYNVLPYRNLSVRGSGSGEEVTREEAGQPIRVEDHLGFRRGLRTLSNLHTGRFGSDATHGSITQADYVSSPSYYKVNRNALLRIEGEEGSYSTGSLFDTWHIQHPIPQNDFQYSWISGSIQSGTTAFGHAPKSGQVSGSEGFEEAISFIISTTQDYESVVEYGGGPNRAYERIELDFVGLNTLVYDPTGSAFNILSASVASAAGYRNLQIATGGIYVNPTVSEETLITVDPFNLLMLHRNGPYGYSSWRQIRNDYHSLVRQMRKNNTVSVIDPDTQREVTRLPIQYLGYQWSPTKTNQQIFGGQKDGSGLKVNQDRQVLSYHEPVLQQKFKPMNFVIGLGGASLTNTKATYANQKKYFVNSKLNANLNINENLKSSADSVINSLSNLSINKLLTARYAETVYPASINVYRAHVRERTTYGNTYWKDSRTDRVVRDTNGTDSLNSQGAPIPSASIWPLDGRLGLDTGTRTDLIRVAGGNGVYSGARADPDLAPNEGELQNSYNTFFDVYPGAGVSMPSGELRSFITGAATYNRRHGMITASSGRSRSSAFGQPTTALIPFSGDAPWDAGKQSGKNPFYNSYSEYVEEMKRIGKDYSILPEYRISERIEDYLVNGVDKFDDTSLLNLTGALANTTSSNQSDFYKVYSHSDFMKYFNVTETTLQASKLSTETSKITVSCHALLKLLPYEGFYPANRTLQLASLFSQSYGEYVSLTGAIPSPTETRHSYWRTFLTPVAAPGVLFNTIKSGIAVDFPLLTGTSNLLPGTKIGGGDLDQKEFGIKNELFDYRVPFETLIEPENYLANFDIIDLEPHPSGAINSTASWSGNGDRRFKMAMHNFLAETPEFFLDNGTFTSFFSRPQSSWEFDTEKTYKMRVQIKKSYNDTALPGAVDYTTTPQIVSGTESIVMYSRPSSFGPPCLGAQVSRSQNGFGGGSLHGYNAPFTPPYYDGAAWVDLEYNPANTNPTIDEVLSQITSSYLRYSTNWKSDGGGGAGDSGGDQGGPQQGDRINNNAVQISASVNLFGKTDGLKELNRYQGFDSSGDDQWVIQTKFETPILNFIDANTNLTTITDLSVYGGGEETRPIGMWHQHGREPTGSEGIRLEVSDHPSQAFESLADAVGFAKTSEKLGRVASSKTIREAVIAVPFFENITTGQRQFFEIDRRQIDTAINGFETGPQANTSEAPITAGDSIRQMVDAMGRYVMPPSMDFIENPDEVNPFAMYIFEFEHTLNKQDLIDIWQNLPPRIGRAFSEDGNLDTSQIKQTKQITHDLRRTDELLNGPLPSRLQWMVFKVKQKANTNYYRKVVTKNPFTNLPTVAEQVANFDPSSLTPQGLLDGSSAPSVTKTVVSSVSKIVEFSPNGALDFIAEGAGAGAVENVNRFTTSYNWPYDFFSLVELVKVDQEVEFDTGEELGQIQSELAPITEPTSRNDADPIVFDFTLSESNHFFIGDPPGYRIADIMVEKFEIGQTSSEAVIQAISDFLIEMDNYEFSTSDKLVLLLPGNRKKFTTLIPDPDSRASISYYVNAGKGLGGKGEVEIHKMKEPVAQGTN